MIIAKKITSDGVHNWVNEPDVIGIRIGSSNNADKKSSIKINRDKTLQVIEGFGGTFNERGWDALCSLHDAERDEVMQNLFAPEHGLHLTIARTPLGASDFAFDAYSYNETPGDYENKSFSIARDERYLLPYIRAALSLQPALEIFASPWVRPPG